MYLLPLPPLSEDALRARAVSERVMLVIRLVVTCLEDVCDSVADDTSASRFDDSTSEGQLRWRRCRNKVRHVLDEGVEGLAGVVADISDNALVIRIGDTCLSFYSARNGVDQPDLSGRSKTKDRVITEMQLQIHGLEAPEAPKRIVIVYEADDDGLARAAAGVLETTTSWHWQVSTYERPGLTLHAPDSAVIPPPYDEQPDNDLPKIEPRPEGEEVVAYDEQPEPPLPEIEPLQDSDEGEDAGGGDAN